MTVHYLFAKIPYADQVFHYLECLLPFSAGPF